MPVAGGWSSQKSGTVTFPLYKVTGDSSNWQWDSSSEANRWTGNGSYYICLVETDSSSNIFSGANMKAHDKVSFDTATVTVAYNTTDWVTP
jgi:hypothetical protein